MRMDLPGCAVSLHVLVGDFRVPLEGNPRYKIDVELLTYLPDEILWRVLEALPLQSKVRFATVCKSWYSRLLSVEALRVTAASALASPAPPLCFLRRVDVETETNYEDCLRAYKGYELNFSYLPSLPNFKCGYFIQDGLLGYLRCEKYFSEEDKNNGIAWRIRLCNPFNRSWRDLPALVIPDDELGDYDYVGWERLVAHDLLEDHKWRINLRVYWDSCNSLQFELLIVLPSLTVDGYCASAFWNFSSSTELWSVTKIDFLVMEEASIESAVLFGGYMYCLMHQKNMNVYSLSDGKLCGRHALGKYCFPETQEFLHSNDCHCGCDRVLLLECQGDVLGVQEFPTASPSPSFGIWKLNLSTMMWGEITIIPQDVHDAFVSQVLETDDVTNNTKLFNLFKVSTVGEYVCLILSYFDCVAFQDLCGEVKYHLLTCHIPTRTWQVGFTNLKTDFVEPQVPVDVFTPRLDIIL